MKIEYIRDGEPRVIYEIIEIQVFDHQFLLYFRWPTSTTHKMVTLRKIYNFDLNAVCRLNAEYCGLWIVWNRYAIESNFSSVILHAFGNYYNCIQLLISFNDMTITYVVIIKLKIEKCSELLNSMDLIIETNERTAEHRT